MSDISNLSDVWREYIRIAKYYHHTRMRGHIIEFNSGISIDLTTLKQDIKLTEAKKVIATAYCLAQYHKNHQGRKKFHERERQARVDGYTVSTLQGLTVGQFKKAFNRITSGRAALAGLG